MSNTNSILLSTLQEKFGKDVYFEWRRWLLPSTKIYITMLYALLPLEGGEKIVGIGKDYPELLN